MLASAYSPLCLSAVVATWIYMATWIYTGEKSTRRIREKYLQAVLRQNIAFFDRMGPGGEHFLPP